MNSGTPALQPARPVIRTLAMFVVLTLIACVVALVSSRPALAQEDLTCQANHSAHLATRWTAKFGRPDAGLPMIVIHAFEPIAMPTPIASTSLRVAVSG